MQCEHVVCNGWHSMHVRLLSCRPVCLPCRHAHLAHNQSTNALVAHVHDGIEVIHVYSGGGEGLVFVWLVWLPQGGVKGFGGGSVGVQHQQSRKGKVLTGCTTFLLQSRLRPSRHIRIPLLAEAVLQTAVETHCH